MGTFLMMYGRRQGNIPALLFWTQSRCSMFAQYLYPAALWWQFDLYLCQDGGWSCKYPERTGTARSIQQYRLYRIFLWSLCFRNRGFQLRSDPRNLQRDTKYIGSQEEDESWDAIWDSAVQSTEDGWQAELRIPFLNCGSLKRMSSSGASMSSAKWKSSWKIQLADSQPRHQWSDQSKWLPFRDKPFEITTAAFTISLFVSILCTGSRNKIKFAGGLDLKYGINDAFTLDMTLIPDFGQVAFDNIVYNLTPFEVQYEERRPFLRKDWNCFREQSCSIPDGLLRIIITLTGMEFPMVRRWWRFLQKQINQCIQTDGQGI